MNRIKVFIAGIIVIAAVSFVVYVNWFPEYKIYWSFSSEGQDFRETELYVMVYKPWRMEQTVEEIVQRHNKMNGVPGCLTVRCYYTQHDMEIGRECYEAVYVYSEEERTDPPAPDYAER